MFNIGEYNRLKILSKNNNQIKFERDILLDQEDIKLLDDNLKKGDYVEVFIYNDRDELKATLKNPKAIVGEIKRLKVIDKTHFGAFLDWGINTDILLPLKETIGAVNIGDFVTVALYIDQVSKRVTASMRLNKFLDKNPTYKNGDKVKASIYSINKDIGIFVIVEGKYNGLVHNEEINRALKIGEELDLIVKSIRRDGNINLYLDEKTTDNLAGDFNEIIDELRKNNGFLPLNYKSNNAEIKKFLNMDKNRFIKALKQLESEDMVIVEGKFIKLDM